MNKRELVKAVAAESGFTGVEAARAANAMLRVIAQSLQQMCIRDSRYIVNVVAVSGPGAARPEDATSENLTAEITVDDQNSAMDIVTDGHYYLGLNPRMLFFNGLGYPTETQYEGDLSTDAPAVSYTHLFTMLRS